MNRTVIVQAGGQSSRMGQNKALLPFLGQPLIERVCQRIAPLGDEILVTAREVDEYSFLGFTVIPDAVEGIGALGGVYSGLLAASSSIVAVVACDMPFVNPVLLSAEMDMLQTGGMDAVVPASEDGLEPLHAVYRPDRCLPAIVAAMQSGQRRLVSWFPMVHLRVMPVDEVRRYDPGLLAFMNLNTVEEFRQAENLARNLS
jgi:molybdenum cofactor guanylyltransferase